MAWHVHVPPPLPRPYVQCVLHTSRYHRIQCVCLVLAILPFIVSRAIGVVLVYFSLSFNLSISLVLKSKSRDSVEVLTVFL